MSTAPQTVAASADGSVRVERVVTSGTFSLDGGTWEVENNVWIVGDGQRCLVIDPAHSPEAVREAVARVVQESGAALGVVEHRDDHGDRGAGRGHRVRSRRTARAAPIPAPTRSAARSPMVSV